MELGNTPGMTEVSTMGNGMKIKLMEKVHTFGQMADNTLDHGRITTCMVEEFILGKMVVVTMVNISMTESMDLVFILGLMDDNIVAIGQAENNTVKEHTGNLLVLNV
jgi:hypothetical protein